VFSSVLPRNAGIVLRIRHTHFTPNPGQFIALALDAVQFELLTKTQNETEKIYNCLENMAIHTHGTQFWDIEFSFLKYQKTCRM
jgi:hypothetical protein